MVSKEKVIRIMNELLLTQEIIWSLPDQTRITEVLIHTIEAIPGVERVQWYEKRDHIDNQSENQLIFPFRSFYSDYGQLVIKCSNITQFQYFSPYIENIVNFASIVLQSKQQREFLFNPKLMQNSQRLQTLGNLTSNIAHDFNNILTSVLGYVNISQMDLEEDHLDKEEIKQNLTEIEKAAHSAQELTRKLLDFSRGYKQKAKRFNFTKLIEDTIDLISSFKPHHINISKNFMMDGLVIKGNPVEYSQVILNLIMNAIEAINHDNGQIKIEVERITNLTRENINQISDKSWVKMKVSDNGMGIPEENLKKIYDPYFTTKTNGTGLGLPTVFRIIKDMNGKIEVQTKVGVGTTFITYFPTNYTNISLTEEREKNKTITRKKQNVKGNIVIIDDSIEVGTITTKLVKKLNYNVQYFSHEMRALNYIRKNANIDAIICDFYLANTTGLELTKMIHNITPDLPIVIASGTIVENSELITNNKEIYDFIAKPINVTKLEAVLNSIVKNKK